MAKNSNEIIQKVDRIHSYPAKFTINLAMEYIQEGRDNGWLREELAREGNEEWTFTRER